MNLTTITEISKNFNISTRTLRYYEQIGLLKSSKKDDYAYRTYDDAAILRLQQIVVLRKLRIPLKQIITILESENSSEIIETLRLNLNEIDDEITALSTIRAILNTFINRLNENTQLDIKLSLIDDITILDVVDSLTVTKIAFKEEKSMEDLNNANEKLNKLEENDIRIIYLPPSTIASVHYIGQDCEMHSHMMLEEFIRKNELIDRKPDLRFFGFNNPIQTSNFGSPSVGYEVWVTIPDDMEVIAPIRKIKFNGGLYAAHCIHHFEFEHWGLLGKWVSENKIYESDWGTKRCTPCMENQEWAFEETLNFYNRFLKNDPGSHQLDLLFPIKNKN
ncbi:MAG: hypothetical protein A2Y17_11190 [Clostridiales bacterium GWF2_38_85]|nr:MAG: hypothetical protein A2Y17_11190 [Clostridiales bacterium GWF2_38_85]HBL84690.1 MerR family transcriptional regulator [Clostridiales bacterium]